MKKLKVNIIYLIGLLVLSLSIGLVFGAFVFNQVVNMDADLGGISIESKNYIDYSLYDYVSSSDENYNRKMRLRKDTVAILDDISLKYTASHLLTSDEQFKDGKTYYYIVNGEYEIATPENNPDYEIGGTIVKNKYYEETRTYNGIDKVNTLFNSSCANLTPTINGNEITFTNSGLTIKVTCELDSTAGVIKSAEAEATDEAIDVDYRCVIDSDGHGLTILDNAKTADEDYYSEIAATSRITCSATQGIYIDSSANSNTNNTNNNKHYLSHYGFKFTFKAEIPVYVRVHIQDAWSSVKVYPSSVKERYVTKDKVSGKTPFNVTESAWHYDEDTNYIYLKQMYNPNNDLDSNGNFKSKSYTFNVNEAYFYQFGNIATVYTEYIDVELSFTVDIVQANRALALWGLDPSIRFS